MIVRVVVVYNSHSGSALTARELKRHFKKADIEVVKLIDITQDVRRQLKPFLNQRKIPVAVYGGDGTINSVAEIIAGTKTVFAPLPGGTLNHFTKDLSISQNIETALAGLKTAKIQHIDTAYVNDHIFLNNSSIGIYPSSLRIRDDLRHKSVTKWAAAVYGSLRAFIYFRIYNVTIDHRSFETPFVFIGNNDYQIEKNVIGQRKNLNKGILSVYAVTSRSRFGLFKLFVQSLFGRMLASDELHVWKTKNLSINTRPKRLSVSRDGEHNLMVSPLRYRIEPRSLYILVAKEK